MREDPRERAALKLVRETDAGIVISGKIGMHTSPAYAEDVYVGSLSGIEIGGHRASFIVPVNAPGVTTVCRKIGGARRQPVRRAAQQPLRRARRPDVARRRVRPVGARVFLSRPSPEPIARWLLWHHLYGWLSKRNSPWASRSL